LTRFYQVEGKKKKSLYSPSLLNPDSLLGFHRKHCNLNIQFSTQSLTGDSLSMTSLNAAQTKPKRVFYQGCPYT